MTKIRLLIEGATIVGPVTIEGLTLSGTYLFRRCVFSEEFNLEGSTLQGSLSFDRCSINAINLCGTKVTGRLFFKNLSNSPECPHRPILFLNSAEIYGPLDIRSCHLGSIIGRSLICSGTSSFTDVTFDYYLDLSKSKFKSGLSLEKCDFRGETPPQRTLPSREAVLDLR